MVKVSQIKPNPTNPRIIKDEKFQKLVASIRDFPEMMEKRPIVCVTDTDKKIYPLGGNMRYRAIVELGYKEIPDNWITLADDWTAEQRNEFIIKDNIGYGEWNWEQLANEWDSEQLKDWGLDVPSFVNTDNINLDDFFEEDNTPKEDDKYKIILEYTEEDYNAVQEALKHHSGSKEQIFFKLLGL